MSDYYLDVVSRLADLPLFAQPAAQERPGDVARCGTLGPCVRR